MTSRTKKPALSEAVVPKTGNPPYPFRTGWALLLLAINLLVAVYYFHIFR